MEETFSREFELVFASCSNLTGLILESPRYGSAS